MPSYIISKTRFMISDESQEVLVKPSIPHRIVEGHTYKLYPIGSHNYILPITFTTSTGSPFVSKYSCGNLSLSLINFPTISTYNQTLSFKHNSMNINIISSSTSSITIDRDNEIVYYRLYNYPLTNLTKSIVSSSIVITADIKNNKHIIIIGRQGITFDNIVREHSINNSVMSCIVAYNDIQNQGRLFTIDLKDETMKSDLIYFSHPNLDITPELIPCAFLESIRIRNVKLARQYMTDRLSTKLDDEHLLSYFSSFDMIIPNNFEYNRFNIVYILNKVTHEMKKVSFDLQGSKIDNVNIN